MKAIRFALVSFLAVAISGALFATDNQSNFVPPERCVFGGHLVQLARMVDLNISKARPLTFGVDLSPIEKNQVRAFLNPEVDLSVEDSVLKLTDDGIIMVHQIFDLVHHKKYYMYVTTQQGQVVGAVFPKGSTYIAGVIENSYIKNCTEEFTNFGSLKFYYDN